MLVSHNYKFIYLKPKKVAGTTTEVFFKKYCINPDNIPLFEEQLKQNDNNITFKYTTEPQYGIITNGKDGDINDPFYKPHMNCDEVIKGVGFDIWDNYTKITNIRNPWDLAVSMFHWRLRKFPKWEQIGFQGFLESKDIQHNMRGNSKVWSYQNQFNFEYIKFESLEEDILKVCKKLEIPTPNFILGNYKKINRKPYQEYYNEITKELVGKIYKKEIEFFNYKF